MQQFSLRGHILGVVKKGGFTFTMIGSRAVSKGAKCVNCRLNLLKIFVFTSESPIRPISIPSSSKPSPGNHMWSRGFGQEVVQRAGYSTGFAARTNSFTGDEETQDPQGLPDSDDGPYPKDSTPWYLQVEKPERESVSLLQRQKLPDLPTDPPPLLQPMLEHIFLDLGLDDLVVFDLRELDPPPALGANLLMVVGTARSEKHLHVSADKFCQWMKNTYRIAPYADGLLGRGELKLKLRRKAKRARILSSVRSSETRQTDDGIRTGWICVTVDNLEDGRPIWKTQRSSDDYVGFGSEERGAKVVIQMLTQEKREELDLEDLWGKTMRRHERKQNRISRSLEGADSEQEVGQSPLYVKGQKSDSTSVTPLSLYSPPRPNHNQIMHLHSSALYSVRRLSQSNRNHSGAAALSHSKSNTTESPTAVDKAFGINEIVVDLPAQDEERVRDSGIESPGTLRLKAHIDFAESLSPKDARSVLGNGARDTDSTAFLRSFHDSLPLLPTAEQWGTRLSLVCIGINLGAPGYDKHQLIVLFRELQSSLINIPTSLYKQTLIALLTLSRSDDDSRRPYLSTTSLHAVASILEDMLFRGHDITPAFDPNNEIRELLELAVLQAQPTDDTSPTIHPEASQRLRRLLNKIYPSPPPLDLELRKMHMCAAIANYQGMWDIWHAFAADMRPRPAELYVAVFQHFADLGHQAKNMEALRLLVPEMAREESPVRMDREIADAVRRCISVVDPRVEEDAVSLYEDMGLGGMDQMGELQKLWWRCERVVQEEARWARESDDD